MEEEETAEPEGKVATVEMAETAPIAIATKAGPATEAMVETLDGPIGVATGGMEGMVPEVGTVALSVCTYTPIPWRSTLPRSYRRVVVESEGKKG